MRDVGFSAEKAIFREKRLDNFREVCIIGSTMRNTERHTKRPNGQREGSLTNTNTTMTYNEDARDAGNELDAIYAWHDDAVEYCARLGDKLHDKLAELDERLGLRGYDSLETLMGRTSDWELFRAVRDSGTPETAELVEEITDMIWDAIQVGYEIAACDFAITSNGDIDGDGTLEERVAELAEHYKEADPCW